MKRHNTEQTTWGEILFALVVGLLLIAMLWGFKTMRVYYAHCIAIYSTPQEDRDVELLEDMGFEVVNPNSLEIHERCERIKEVHKTLVMVRDTPLSQSLSDALERIQATLAEIAMVKEFKEAGQAVMEIVFKPIASASDALVFRGLPDGRIPAGVAQEIGWAREAGVPVFELPSNVIGRVMSIEATREYLREIGAR